MRSLIGVMIRGSIQSSRYSGASSTSSPSSVKRTVTGPASDSHVSSICSGSKRTDRHRGPILEDGGVHVVPIRDIGLEVAPPHPGPVQRRDEELEERVVLGDLLAPLLVQRGLQLLGELLVRQPLKSAKSPISRSAAARSVKDSSRGNARCRLAATCPDAGRRSESTRAPGPLRNRHSSARRLNPSTRRTGSRRRRARRSERTIAGSPPDHGATATDDGQERGAHEPGGASSRLEAADLDGRIGRQAAS